MSRTGWPATTWALELDLSLLGHAACSIDHGMKSPPSDSGFLPDVFHSLRQILDLFDANHVKLCIALLGDLQRQRERIEGVIGAVVCVEYPAEHGGFLLSSPCWELSEQLPHLVALVLPALPVGADGAAKRRHLQ